MDTLPASKTAINIVRVRRGEVSNSAKRDFVATEEPLQIRLETPDGHRNLAVTMRTPGADFELVTGFLFGEGIIQNRNDIQQISYCVDRELNEAQRYNVVNVVLRRDAGRDLRRLDRHFVVSSACGVCGKTNLDDLEMKGLRPLDKAGHISLETIFRLNAELRNAQQVFESTGGLHAAALFDFDGKLLAIREDVGRHNAMDKLIGWAVMEGKVPLEGCAVLVSGRSSFELVQKALVARIPIFCAISAPSSLAVDLARRFQMTLIGFLRDDNFNIYNGETRIVGAQDG